MRSLFLRLMLVFALATAGCSDDPDPIDTPNGEDTSVEETGPDTTLPEDTVVPADTAVAEDTFLPETSEAAPPADSLVATDAATEVAPDTCVRNACGTCTALSAAPGAACGGCGKYECAADGESVVCKDPGTNACGGCGTLAAAPGTACGTCGTSSYACSADKKTTACTKPDDRNLCGGCTTLANAPGGLCGVCGTYTCSADMTTTTCVDVATTGSGPAYGPGSVTPVSPGLSTNSYAFAFTLGTRGQITNVALRIQWMVATPGTARVDIYQGTPGGAATLLGSSIVDATTMPGYSPAADIAPGFTNFTLSSPTTSLPAGTAVYVQVSRASGSNTYRVWGSASGGPATLSSWNYSGSWSSLDPFDPAILVDMKGCF